MAQIVTFARDAVTAMTNDPKFPSPNPALPLVTAAIVALAVAESVALTRAKGHPTTRNDEKAGRRTQVGRGLQAIKIVSGLVRISCGFVR